jgi:hypothetical protein
VIMSYLPDDESGEGFEEEAASEDLSRVHDDDLEASIPAMQRRIDALQGRLAIRVAEYDRRGLAAEGHVLSTKQWLTHTCRITTSHAATLLRTGQALEHMPNVTALAASGAITTGAVRKLTAARNRYPEAFVLHEVVLADAATYLRPRDLRRAIAHWEQQVSYPDAVAEVASKRQRRRLSINQTWDGMWAVSGELDPETGHVVTTALRAQVDPTNLDPADDRTNAQRMADGLADICRFSLDHDESLTTSGGTKPHVTVTVDYATLTRVPGTLPEIDGLATDPETIRRIACDADIVRMIVGPDSEILDVGRSSRSIPTAIRRALDHRDGGCTWEGCDAPPQWTDAHHIKHWADGGETSLDNLILLCRTHHTAIHESTVTTDSDPPET